MDRFLETDVVVIGFGGAGAAAAISAHDLGARVIVVEKSENGGGNTAASLGRFLYTIDAEGCYAYVKGLMEKSKAEYDARLLKTYASGLVQNVRWIRKLGGKILIYSDASFPEISGASKVKRAMVSEGMWSLLLREVKRRAIRVLNNARATDLIKNSRGRIVGVMVKSQRNMTILARRGVVLTTGGFEYNESLKHDCLKGPVYYSVGSPSNTGDGIEMVGKLGAQLWHMNVITCALGFRDPKHGQMYIVRLDRGLLVFPGNHSRMSSFAFILVDQRGKRFVNESAVDYHNWNLALDYLDPAALTYPRIPCYLIFDERTRRLGAIAHDTSHKERQSNWSGDNLHEIKKGWITSGLTVQELASKIGLDAEAISLTVNEYNKACHESTDREFGRTELEPLEQSPFYAIKLWPALENTQGGPRRNVKSQVLGQNGNPIGRLYSAGELGSLWSHIYQGGGNIGECLVFGRIAGTNAANEIPLSFSNYRNKV